MATGSNSVVVLDAGNSDIKAKTAGQEERFPHALFELPEIEYERVMAQSKGKPPEGYTRVNGRPYAWGNLAERKGTVTRLSGAARYTKEYYGILVGIALSQLYSRGGDVSLFASHPPGDAQYANDLLKAALGTYHIEVGDHETSFRVVDGSTFDEPVGGLMNVMLKDNGQQYARTDITDGDTLIIDIGGLTTDLLSVAVGGQVDYAVNASADVGIRQVLDYFWSSLRGTYKSELKDSKRLPTDRLGQALHEGRIPIGGRTYPCENEASEAANIVLNQIGQLYKDVAGGPARWDTIILTGGGSALLCDRLINEVLNHRNVLLAERTDELGYANVRGGLKLWRFYEAEGVV
ncbi:MAG: ParM/StbA family protein [Anaerolineae bacterium]|nr:ParM/StbA family protein [Anaerolineae bacterium]